MRPFDIARFDVGGVPVAALDMAAFVAAVDGWLASRDAKTPGAFVCYRDAHGIVRAQDDPALLEVHRQALFVVPDGRPLVWIGRRRGHRRIGPVCGMSALPTLCEAGLSRGWRHVFLGGGPGVAEELARVLTARYPGLIVAGTECPPFAEMAPAEIEAMRARLRAARPDILWVGLGSPKQDHWMATHAPHLPGVLAMGVGGAFDVNIGRVPRAPAWVQASGLEWAYRLVREPRRLWRRYAEVVPRFAWLALRETLWPRLNTAPPARPASGADRSGQPAA